MKKYFLAGVVAMVAFAMAAFAASLNVNAGPLQAGIDPDMVCSDDADITYDTQTVGGGLFGIKNVLVQFDPSCAGAYAHLALYSNNPTVGAGNTQFVGNAIQRINETGLATFKTTAPGDALSSDVNAVAVQVKNAITTAEAGWSGGGALANNPIPALP